MKNKDGVSLTDLAMADYATTARTAIIEAYYKRICDELEKEQIRILKKQAVIERKENENELIINTTDGNEIITNTIIYNGMVYIKEAK